MLNPLVSCSQKINRVEWIDIARGIGIILVVYGHVLRGLEDSRLVGSQGLLRASDHAIYTFHMPLFFFLAGLNVERSYRKGSAAFIRSRLVNIAYPYLLWSLIQGFIQLALPGYVNTPRSMLSLVSILWHPIAQFWFLYVILCCHVLAWVTRINRGILLVTTCCAILVPADSYGSMISMTIRFWPFYAVGILLSDACIKASKNRQTMLLLALSICVFTFTLLYGEGGPIQKQCWDLASAASGIASTVLLSRLIESSASFVAARLLMLGQMSMTIYILHVLVTATSRILLRHQGVTSVSMQLVIGTTAGVVVPMLIGIVFSRVKVAKLVGLPTLRMQTSRMSVLAEQIG